MIEVRHLTRRFGPNLAVSDATFDVEKGAILGFLGLNGAGKSTTMRMLTCFLRPTSGTARIGGKDIQSDPLAVRRQVGYLPESNPLYVEMRVDEYLSYRAALKGVERGARKKAMGEVMERCGLGEVRRRVIGHLSRGYRQRVGLADALVHDPQVLILDEPTVGLDPSQIRQVRGMVRDLATKRTVVISTHILGEVEAVCDQVVIIDRGKIIVHENLEDLRKGIAATPRFRAEIRSAGADVASILGEIPGVTSVEDEGGDPFRSYRLETEEGADPREALFLAAIREGWSLRELRMDRRTLEEIFMEITQREGDG